MPDCQVQDPNLPIRILNVHVQGNGFDGGQPVLPFPTGHHRQPSAWDGDKEDDDMDVDQSVRLTCLGLAMACAKGEVRQTDSVDSGWGVPGGERGAKRKAPPENDLC